MSLSSFAAQIQALTVQDKDEFLVNGNLSGSDEDSPEKNPVMACKSSIPDRDNKMNLTKLLRSRETSTHHHGTAMRFMTRALIPDRMATVGTSLGHPLNCGRYSKDGRIFAIAGKVRFLSSVSMGR